MQLLVLLYLTRQLNVFESERKKKQEKEEKKKNSKSSNFVQKICKKSCMLSCKWTGSFIHCRFLNSTLVSSHLILLLVFVLSLSFRMFQCELIHLFSIYITVYRERRWLLYTIWYRVSDVAAAASACSFVTLILFHIVNYAMQCDIMYCAIVAVRLSLLLLFKILASGLLAQFLFLCIFSCCIVALFPRFSFCLSFISRQKRNKILAAIEREREREREREAEGKKKEAKIA